MRNRRSRSATLVRTLQRWSNVERPPRAKEARRSPARRGANDSVPTTAEESESVPAGSCSARLAGNRAEAETSAAPQTGAFPASLSAALTRLVEAGTKSSRVRDHSCSSSARRFRCLKWPFSLSRALPTTDELPNSVQCSIHVRESRRCCMPASVVTQANCSVTARAIDVWRAACLSSCTVILVRLTKKLAECLDDIDLSKYHVGDLLELPDRDAGMLIAEGCAERVEQRRQERDRRKTPPERAAR